MTRKVIYIGYQPITSKFYSDYYMDTCIEKGLDVEYWDISKLYFPKIYFPIPFDFASIKKIKSFGELKALLSSVEIKSTVFITNITYEFRVLRFFIILSSFNCTLVAFGRGMFPTPEKSEATKILEIISSFNLKRMITGLKNKAATMIKHFHLIKPYDLIFISGSEGYNTLGFGNYYDMENAKIINVNYFDYDKYLTPINQLPLVDKEYCVFLDEYLPYHPDFEMLGIKNVSADIYYSQLNNFFDFIENKFNIYVIIAAHPKALRYKSENPFNGRVIFFNLTCELVRDAAFVMTHYSSSISYPVLFKKPILFLTSQAQKKSMPHSHELTLYLRKYLNSEIIYFDNFCYTEKYKLQIDIEKYEDYKYKYLTSKESEKRLSSEIFIEAILQI